MDLGAKFWLELIGVCIGVAIAGWLVFVLLGYAWYAWGLVATLVIFGGIAVGIAWIIDRRDQRRRDSLTA
jgi:bacteriorhodopsin